MQGDSVTAKIFADLSVDTEFTAQGAELVASPELSPRLILDLAQTPDLVPALVVTCVMLRIPSVSYTHLLIMVINGDTVLGKTTPEVSNLLKGPAGTPLSVTVKRPYVTDSIITVQITREKIQNPSVPYYGVVGNDLGYILLSSYTETTPEEVRLAIDSLKNRHKVKGPVSYTHLTVRQIHQGNHLTALVVCLQLGVVFCGQTGVS